VDQTARLLIESAEGGQQSEKAWQELSGLAFDLGKRVGNFRLRRRNREPSLGRRPRLDIFLRIRPAIPRALQRVRAAPARSKLLDDNKVLARDSTAEPSWTPNPFASCSMKSAGGRQRPMRRWNGCVICHSKISDLPKLIIIARCGLGCLRLCSASARRRRRWRQFSSSRSSTGLSFANNA